MLNGSLYMQKLNLQMQDDDCTYVIYVQTGDAKYATTHATVNPQLRDKYFDLLNITNLQSYGVMGKQHYYFKEGNLDAFAIKGKCLRGPLCSMTLSHDNTGVSPDWYVDYVEVTAIAPNHGCRTTKFPVNAWIAGDKPPFGSASWGVYLCDEIINHDSCTPKF